MIRKPWYEKLDYKLIIIIVIFIIQYHVSKSYQLYLYNSHALKPNPYFLALIRCGFPFVMGAVYAWDIKRITLHHFTRQRILFLILSLIIALFCFFFFDLIKIPFLRSIIPLNIYTTIYYSILGFFSGMLFILSLLGKKEGSYHYGR